MSSCSSSEIAEKKRIALEKLQARKARLLQSVNNKIKVPVPNNNNKSSTDLENRKNFYQNGRGTQSQPNASASTFLNSLKQSSTFTHRKEARDMSHPYQRAHTEKSPNTNEMLGNSIVSKSKPLSPKKFAPVFTNSVTCKLYMISKTNFAVQTSGFHAKLIEVFKTMPSKYYDDKTRIWSFALKDYELLQQRVAVLKPQVIIGVIPRCVINLCLSQPKEMDHSCLASIETVLVEKLLPFQKEGVCFAIAQHGRVMICDEMGLGKTYQALAVADFYKEDWPLLICTTAATRDAWSTHVRNLLPSIPIHYVQTLINNQQYFGDSKILITSYNMMERHQNKLLEHKFGCLIFDESHMLKNSKAKCTTVADRLAMHAKHIILLSGTPALSRPLELFSQLHMIDRKFMNFMDYTSRYCDGKQSNFGWDATGQSNLQELNVVLKLKYMIRRTKEDVLPEMTEKFRETVVLDPALVWQNDDIKKSLDVYAKNYNASKGREKEEILLQFYARTGEIKTKAVCAYLKSILKENIKFIVFAHHLVMIDAVCDFLTRSEVDFIRIDGRTRNNIRVENIKRFQTNSDCKVAVLSIKACNSGITLTAAELIVFAELDWNPSILAQAESRAHRIGQEKNVTCRYLMATKTADDLIWNMLKSKQDTLNKAGLFCENLQEATTIAAPTMSRNIEQYFTPEKSKKITISATTSETTPKKTHDASDECTTSISNADLLKGELENIEDFFQDDDAFENLAF